MAPRRGVQTLVPRFAGWLVRRRMRLFVLALLAIAGATATVDIPAFSGSLRGFDLRDNEFYATKIRADALFGGRTTIYVTVTPTSAVAAEVIESVKKLEARVRAALPRAQILSLSTYYDLAYASRYPGATTEHFLSLAARTRIVRDLVARDRSTFLVLVRVPQDAAIDVAKFSSVIRDDYQGIANPSALSMFHVEETIRRYIIRDFAILTAGVILVLIALFLYIYRRLTAVGFAAANIAISVLASLFFFSALRVDLNLVTILVIPIVVILSLADSVHLLTAYASSETADSEERLSDVLSLYVVPSFYSSLTTAVAFFTFYLYSDAEFIQDFGLVTAAALMTEFLVTFMVSPFLLHALNLRSLHATDVAAGAAFLHVHRKALSTGFLLILVASAFLVFRLQFSTSTRTFFPRGADVTIAHDRFNQQYYSQVDLEILVEHRGPTTGDEARERLDAYVDQLAARLEAEPLVTRVTSARDRITIPSLIPVSIPIGDLLEGANPYYDSSANVHRVLVRFHDADVIEDFYNSTFLKLRNEAPEGVMLTATSVFLIMDAVNEHVASSLVQSLLTAGLAIALMILVLTRSAMLALLCLIPNVVPLAIVTLVFIVFGFHINILTAITAVVCLGLLDDDTIHILYRRIALRRPLEEVSVSILSTTVVLVAGFALFSLSSFRPIQVFGTISAIVFLFGVVCDLTLMPAIIDRWLPSDDLEKAGS
jgi:predicted RND superfamily exporter protein